MYLQIQKKWLPFLLIIQLQIFYLKQQSGNPINAEGFEQMISDDIVQEKAEITKIHRFEFLK